jgi:hypothetical protein
MSGYLSTRRSLLSRLAPLTLSRISVGFALIAALWLVVASVRGDIIALVAAAAVFGCAHSGRVLAGQRPPVIVEWGLAGYGMLAEFAVYAGLAAAAGLHPAGQPGLAGRSLGGTFVAGLGGVGTAGVWRLAIVAATLTVLTPMVDLCVHGASPTTARPGLFGPPSDVRLPLACLTVLVLGTRAAFLVVIVLAVAALSAIIFDGTRQPRDRGELRGYRGDGRISIWIGKWVGGRVPPLPPLLVGLLVTGVLAALGLRNLPGILLLTPVEAMLLAAFASWHPHVGPGDWVGAAAAAGGRVRVHRRDRLCRPRLAAADLRAGHRRRAQAPGPGLPGTRRPGGRHRPAGPWLGGADDRRRHRGGRRLRPGCLRRARALPVVAGGQGLGGRLVSSTCPRQPIASPPS